MEGIEEKDIRREEGTDGARSDEEGAGEPEFFATLWAFTAVDGCQGHDHAKDQHDGTDAGNSQREVNIGIS